MNTILWINYTSIQKKNDIWKPVVSFKDWNQGCFYNLGNKKIKKWKSPILGVPAVAQPDWWCLQHWKAGLIPDLAQWVKWSGVATAAVEVATVALIWSLALGTPYALEQPKERKKSHQYYVPLRSQPNQRRKKTAAVDKESCCPKDFWAVSGQSLCLKKCTVYKKLAIRR